MDNFLNCSEVIFFWRNATRVEMTIEFYFSLLQGSSHDDISWRVVDKLVKTRAASFVRLILQRIHYLKKYIIIFITVT